MMHHTRQSEHKATLQSDASYTLVLQWNRTQGNPAHLIKPSTCPLNVTYVGIGGEHAITSATVTGTKTRLFELVK